MFKQITIIMVLLITAVSAGCVWKTSEELYSEGVKLLREGKPGGAIVLFKNALEKNQNYLDARYELARAYQSEKKYELAEKEFQKVKLLNPNQPGIYLDLARLSNNLGKPDQAINHANEHLLIEKDSADAMEVIAIAYVLKKMPQDAEIYFLRVLKIDPAKISAKLELAGLYVRERRMAQAEELLQEITTVNPKNVRALYLQADLMIIRGEKEQAHVIYKKLEAINPSDQIAAYKAGLLDFELGRTAIAESVAVELIKKFPANAEGYRLQGIAYYRNKNFKEAITSLQHANKIQQSIPGYYFLGLSLYGNGDLESAMNQFRHILDQAPAFHQARLLVGTILLQQKRVDDAVTELTRVLETDAKNPQAHNMLGSAYIAKGMLDEGLRELDTAIKLEPKLVDAYLKKGMLHLSKGKTAEVEIDLATAVRVAPELLNSRLILASYHESRNNRNKAFTVLRDGLTGKKTDALLYCGMARLKFADDRPLEAVSYLTKAKESDSGSVLPFFMLAAYYIGQHDHGKAQNEYTTVLQREPRNVKAMLRMATLMESTKRDDEAVAWYQKAKETQDPAAYIALASMYFRKGNHDMAQKSCDELIQKRPEYAPAYFTQGTFLESQGLKKEAITKYRAALAQSAKYAAPLNNIAYLYLEGFGRKEEALQLAENAIALEPANPGIMDTVGYALLKNNRFPEALQYLEKAVALLPDDPTVNYHLALAHKASGDKKQATVHLQKALRIEKFASIREARTLLAELN